jgi:hypothetical protein
MGKADFGPPFVLFGVAVTARRLKALLYHRMAA